MNDYCYCCVCEEPCSAESPSRIVGGCSTHICDECDQLADCRDCGGSGEVDAPGEMKDCCDRCGGTGKE